MSYEVGDKVLTLVGGKWHPATITKPAHKETGNFGVRLKAGTRVINTMSSPKELKPLTESIKDLDLNASQIRSLERAVDDYLLAELDKDVTVEVTHVQDEGDCMKLFYTYEDPKTHKDRQGSMYFTASIKDNKIEDFAEKSFTKEDLTERVHTLKNPNIKPIGAPADKARAFDKVNAKTGARKNRSVLKAMAKAKPEQEYFALDVSEDPDYTMVLVMKAGLYDHEYYGVNVLFYPDGKVDASTADSLSDKQWAKDKREIIKVARKQLKSAAPMGDLDSDVRAYHGAGDGDYHGYQDKKMNEAVRAKMLDLSKKPGEQTKDPESQDERDELAKTVRGNRNRVKAADSRDVHPNMRRGAASGQTNLHANSRFVSGQDAKQASVRNEGKLTFKQFLMFETAGPKKHYIKSNGSNIAGPFDSEDEAEKALYKLQRNAKPEDELDDAKIVLEAKKVKEPGWYVCDHMDKPVDGPMQERGAKAMADEMNAKHADKHGKGDITPYSAEYFSDYEIRRMNEKKVDDEEYFITYFEHTGKGRGRTSRIELYTERAFKSFDAAERALEKFKSDIGNSRDSDTDAADDERDLLDDCSITRGDILKRDYPKLFEGFGEPGEYLNRSQKAALLKDFEEWSGGFTPDDCTDAQVREYVKHGISKKLPLEAAKKYLAYIRDNGASNAP